MFKWILRFLHIRKKEDEEQGLPDVEGLGPCEVVWQVTKKREAVKLIADNVIMRIENTMTFVEVVTRAKYAKILCAEYLGWLDKNRPSLSLNKRAKPLVVASMMEGMTEKLVFHKAYPCELARNKLIFKIYPDEKKLGRFWELKKRRKE